MADTRYHFLDGEWNSSEIVVMESKYAIHKFNGQIVNLATDLGSAEGPIALEAETGEILWRNIEIKEYEEPVPMEQFLKE
ncbi:family 16 glycoside hydrolase [Maribacter sp. MAR_2009_72]|uniref:family 16 glycoside hydrolase n=1 Tax=Maribacter sp. MAR_2009_72 TaxID=1250050 RepID=UPI0011A59FFB|nr:family 16 glycoside hydrolase [Maribacter sp. MAR_2009_72]